MVGAFGLSSSQCKPHSKASCGGQSATLSHDSNGGLPAFIWQLAICHHFTIVRGYECHSQRKCFTHDKHASFFPTPSSLTYFCLPFPFLCYLCNCLPLCVLFFVKHFFSWALPVAAHDVYVHFPLVTRGNIDGEGLVDLSRTKGWRNKSKKR